VGPFYYRWKEYTNFAANEERLHVVGINYTYDVPKLAGRLGMNHAVGRQILDGWSIAHLMNFYSGRTLTPSFGLQYANNTQGVANINSIFTGSPDIGPRILPAGDPNNGVASPASTYDVTRFGLPGIPDVGMGSRNYLYSPGTFSNDVNVSKDFPITEGRSLELRASLFNPFNQVRRQDINTSHTYKMRGARLENGYFLFNSPEMQVSNLVSRLPNSTEAEKYNQFRGGVGHSNVTSVLDMRRVEVGLRFKF
jgi:hypothetical protein